VVSVPRDGVWIGNWIYWALTLVTTNSYNSLSELHTPKITVTAAHIKSSQSSLAVAWQRLPTTDIPLPLSSRTVPGLSYQFPTSRNCIPQLTRLDVKAKVTLPLTVSQSVSLGVEPHIFITF
jgi:hypothetical protein